MVEIDFVGFGLFGFGGFGECGVVFVDLFVVGFCG